MSGEKGQMNTKKPMKKSWKSWNPLSFSKEILAHEPKIVLPTSKQIPTPNAKEYNLPKTLNAPTQIPKFHKRPIKAHILNLNKEPLKPAPIPNKSINRYLPKFKHKLKQQEMKTYLAKYSRFVQKVSENKAGGRACNNKGQRGVYIYIYIYYI